ncbi:MAG: hypothetical protein HWE11_09120 [Gammaproteobacteria bacterium]|nr:hypothetical protein [Gammaproteobacteria bacterium]
MIQRTTFALIVLCASLLAGDLCASEKHYRHIMFRESPYAAYRGIHPIDVATSQAVQHYEFAYDPAGRLTRVSQKLGDKRIAAHGTWDSFIWFAPEVRIEYTDNQEVHTYYGLDGAQIEAHGKVWRAVYSLDKQGQRRALAFYDRAGEPVESEWQVQRYEWRVAKDGQIFERRFNLSGELAKLRPELEFYEVKLEYDFDGKLMFMRNYGLNHELTNNETGAAIDRITYDLAGNFVRWQVYNKEGMPVEGNRPMVHMGEHLYDAFGNKIGLRGFDRFGNPMTFSWGDFMQRTWYNAHGVRSALQVIQADGSIDLHLTYQYTEDLSAQIGVTSIDANGALKNDPRLNGAAQVKFQLNEQGVRVPLFFAADGSPMKR